MFNPDKYRSVIWLRDGRVYPQLDCFGTVNEIRHDLNLPVWPDFVGVTKSDGGLDREARRVMLTPEHYEPCEGVGMVCYSGSTITCVGIVASIDDLLHVAGHSPGTNVTFLSLPWFKHQFVKMEFWR